MVWSLVWRSVEAYGRWSGHWYVHVLRAMEDGPVIAMVMC